METEQNQLRTPDLPVEGPTLEDGNFSSTPAAPIQQPAARVVQEDAADRGEPQQWRDDKRSEIFANAKQRRQAETQPFSGDPNDPNALYGSDVDQSDLGELEKEALRRRQENIQQATGQQPQQGQQPQRKPLNGIDPQFLAQTVPIIVDGQQFEVPIEDLARDFQINRAADKRLEQARALLQQTHEFQRGQPQPGTPAGYADPSGQDDLANVEGEYPENGNTSRAKVDTKDLVEKIQLGTPDEAAQALEDFISSAVHREAPVDDTTRVLMALEDANSKQAVMQFAQANPQIANSPELQAAATREIQRLMALDLIEAGYSVDQLRQLAPSPQHLTNLHKQARVQRLKGVRSVSELLPAGYHGAVQGLRSLVEQAAPQQQAQNPAPTMQQRQQRKEALQTQPTARRLSPSLSAPSQNRTQEQSRSAAVARIRQSRGQPV